jgi:hypothetical protein
MSQTWAQIYQIFWFTRCGPQCGDRLVGFQAKLVNDVSARALGDQDAGEFRHDVDVGVDRHG